MGFEKLSKSYFGSNYEKAKRNYELGVLREKLSFQRKYPSANVKNFVYNADLSKDGDLVSTFTRYKKDESLPEITSYLFKKFYADTLHWQPRLWGPDGTIQPFVLNTNPFPYNVTKFKVYMNEKQSFLNNFDTLETSWKGTEKDITKVAVSKEDPYFISLLAASIISHVGGISRKHLTESEKIPKIVTSIARYYVHYHMKRFFEDPGKMDSYITNEMKKLVKNNLQTRKIWKRKFVRTRANISYWYSQHPNRRNIRRYRYVMSKNNTGALGIEYEEVDDVVPKSDEDWIAFVKEDSDGLTKTGQKLLQLAAESYVYVVLGSQAQTRWSVVGRGAKSLQTQDIFHRLVKDTITQDDPVKAISNMRTAIKDTNVWLNMVITPGIILIPSDMIISKEKIAGCNNTLTLVTKEMKFGINEEVNKMEPPKEPKTIPQAPKEPKEPTTTQKDDNPVPQTEFSVIPKISDNDDMLPLLGSAITLGFLVAKYVM